MAPNDDTKRMARVMAAMRQSAEVVNDLTPSQSALITKLGVAPVDLWLGILALMLPDPVDGAGRDDHSSFGTQPARKDEK